MSKIHEIYRLALIGLSVGSLLACSEEIESDPGARVIRAAALDFSPASEPASGRREHATHLYSERNVEVHSRLGGSGFFEQGLIIKAIHVEVGDQVKAGQLLARLEDDEAGIELQIANAKADQAKNEYERMAELNEKEFVSPSEFDAALYAMRQALAELERAKLSMSRTRVRAPFAGVLASRYVREGELVEEGTPLFRVTAMAPLKARLLVPEAEADVFNVGAPVNLTGLRGERATARVIVVGPTVDPASGTREVIVELVEPGPFRPGSAVMASPAAVPETEAR